MKGNKITVTLPSESGTVDLNGEFTNKQLILREDVTSVFKSDEEMFPNGKLIKAIHHFVFKRK